jgi:hypothetical protein
MNSTEMNTSARLRLLSLLTFLCYGTFTLTAQTDPVITKWLQNTTGILGRHYVQGNPVPIQDNVPANVQMVQYSDDWSYIHTNGIPAYITGPFLDGNPSLAHAQNAIFRFPRTPQPNTGTPTATNAGNIGNFINGVALFDYRDGVAWNTATNALCGGPGNPPCPGGPGATLPWNRDAVLAEREGFDCAKGHPAMGNYHHHQNPSAFDLDLVVISNVCDIYAADGLYVIDPAQHSPLLGFAYDGYPIYGAYGYANADGSGGIERIRSGYQLRNISVRTHHADGTDVADGPVIGTEYPLGYFREDYEFIDHPGEENYLDEHNGRYCVTPEYPSGTYAYFCTVDENHNSAYPYAVGPTFYGIVTAGEVTSIGEAVTTYSSPTAINENISDPSLYTVFPNPTSDIVAIQVKGILLEDLPIALYDLKGQQLRTSVIQQGATIWYLDTRTLYDGEYLVRIGSGENVASVKVVVAH